MKTRAERFVIIPIPNKRYYVSSTRWGRCGQR